MHIKCWRRSNMIAAPGYNWLGHTDKIRICQIRFPLRAKALPLIAAKWKKNKKQGFEIYCKQPRLLYEHTHSREYKNLINCYVFIQWWLSIFRFSSFFHILIAIKWPKKMTRRISLKQNNKVLIIPYFKDLIWQLSSNRINQCCSAKIRMLNSF